jgi:hypothetical protein
MTCKAYYIPLLLGDTDAQVKMEVEDEIFLEDDQDILDIIAFGFPRQLVIRPNYIQDMDDLSFFRRFRLTKETSIFVLSLIEDQLEFTNDL